MILKISKTLNEKKEFSLISFDIDNKLDNVDIEKFNDSDIYESDEYYYFYIENIIDIGNCEKFKIKAKKGDIVTLTAKDNSFVVFPSKRSFAITFNLNYTKVLNYTYDEVLLEGKPYEVKYVKDNEAKINDGVVYTLGQLVTYISIIIKNRNYNKISAKSKSNDTLNRVIMKYYSSDGIKIDKKYELNVKKVWIDSENKWHSRTIVNVTKSNKYEYDYYLLRMFAYMILTKSLNDVETNNDPIYCFDRKFDTLEDVYSFLEENQDIVNNFFIETELLFTRTNETLTSYAPYISGVYMYYCCNGVKTYLYRTADSSNFNDKSLKGTYVSTRYRHKIKGIKMNYSAR